MMSKTIQDIENEARQAECTGLFANVMRISVAYQRELARETRQARNDAWIMEAAIKRIELAYGSDSRFNPLEAPPDMLLVQLMKDVIATSQVAKIVDPGK